ncbi:peptidoglycan -binding protein [Pelagibius litoralis]|uniref:Peptidoglycan -binding protein n=1 Tax=Pelagibius litoralis TaxID=374515 RepID=A0A967K8K9_9PROT|nr:peptidoglycan -binding protein [Pelagibius litoralis]NIA70513.1 peptidoglycan -binding protein [Pelagibius litoralis]
MYALGRGGSRRSINIWPGFVDGLATLLMVVIFVLMVFMVAQFFLTVAITGKDEALLRLENEINELADLLALERNASTELRTSVAQLSSELQSSLAARESLAGQLAALTEQRESLAEQLAALADERDSLASLLAAEQEESNRLAALANANDEELEQARSALAERDTALAESQQALDARQAELDAALARLQTDQKKLEEALAAIAAGRLELEAAYTTIDADKEKIEAQLAELAILKSLRDDLVEKLRAAEAAGQDTSAALVEQTKLSEEAQIQISLLNQQLAVLRQQLSTLSEALDLAESQNEAQQVQIADLGKRLNVALASKVQELARYRSEFFGRLREAIGNRQDIRIVGDRFVFQSEILFQSGSATIGDQGQVQLGRLAETLKEISGTIPTELDWVMRVDGHTDRAPIATFQFPSNWELSAARAIAVVKFMIDRGIPANRLAATGFGEFQPLDGGNDEIAFRRNRRIEFKLTQR